ncbi:filamentous hemagglutinin [Leptolyngbya valderiana BDU 20041]|nr:filamentous hemagglutinin [Leptolyngbya valderiana BDU 20041]
MLNLLSFGILFSKPTFSQIVPDNTLPVPSQVNLEGSRYTLEGGTEAGSNLFHSFQDFSIPTGSEAFFNNATSIENILTRVTGGNISNIDGFIRANGTANLFLLNPNGIVFGPNARLDIGGSFIGSTADSLQLSDGSFFSATNPQAPSLLTVNVPIGLQLGANSGEIRVEGTGHGLTFDTSDRFFPPFTRPDAVAGLSVRPQNTIALVGSNINLSGGVLTAESGRIELGSVSSGTVSLTPSSSGFALEYDGISNFRDLHLSQQAGVDASGAGQGGIYLVGRRIDLTEGSVALIQNTDATPDGEIAVAASESLEIVGTTPGGEVRSSLNQETVSSGSAGDIRVVAGRLRLAEGGQIIIRTFDTGSGGNIDLDIIESIDIVGSSPENPVLFSSIFSIVSGGALGEGGNVNLSTERLTLLDGGILSASTFGSGNAGNLNVNASESVELLGIDPVFESPSDLTVATNSNGNGGNLTLTTTRLVVSDGARVNASSVEDGNAGIVTIDASESIDVNGGTIRSSVQLPTSVEGFLLDFSGPASGIAGNVTIRTPRLNVRDRGTITVQNDALSNAGSLSIDVGSLRIDSEGAIAAATASGEGGNINLRVEGALIMRDRGQISAEAGGTGNGGNIALDTGTIAAIEGSNMSANAFEGTGGNIQLTAQGIFLSPDSRITASSQFGVDGLVTITQPEIDTASGLVELASEPIDPTTQVVSVCEAAANNTFVVTGNGGLPPDPTSVLRHRTVWVDTGLTEIQPSSVESENEERSPATELDSSQLPLVEATGWQWRNDGTIELVSTPQNRVGNRWGDRVDCSDR